MKEFLSRSGAIELCVLAAYPSRDETLSVGFEAYDRANKQALTVIARVDPATLGFEVIAEIEGVSLAYATDRLWVANGRSLRVNANVHDAASARKWSTAFPAL